MIDTHYHPENGLYHARDRYNHREAWDIDHDKAHDDCLNMASVLAQLFGYCEDTPPTE